MNNPIKVAMIIHSYYPVVGGAERQIGTVAPLLQAQGVEIHIVTRRYSGLAPFEVVKGVPVHRLPIPKPVASPSFTLNGIRLLQTLKPDVLHAYDLSSPLTTAIAAKRLFGTPVVVKVLRGGALGDIDRIKHKFLGKQRLESFKNQVDAFITISKEIDAELAGIGIPVERRPFIPNGVDTDRFEPLSADDKRALRKSLGLPEDAPTAVYTGRLVSEKRVNHLIDIWPAVRAEHPNALLVVVGTGEEEAALRKAAGEGVHFTGRVEDVAPYLKAADLFILPSATEGLSNALLEALAAGLAAVVTEVGGAADVIEHGKSGWLIPADNVPMLRDGIIKLLGSPDLRAEFGRRARERIMQDYRLPVTAERLRSLYERVLQNKRETVS